MYVICEYDKEEHKLMYFGREERNKYIVKKVTQYNKPSSGQQSSSNSSTIPEGESEEDDDTVIIPHPPAADGIPLIGLFDHECDLNDENDDGFGTALVPDDEPSGVVARSSIEGEPES